MIRPAAPLSARLIRRPRGVEAHSPAPRPAPSALGEDIRLFLWAWAVGFVAFLIFVA